MDARDYVLIHVLGDRNTQYVVPDFQRVISWGKDEIDRLLEDLESVVSAPSEHFMGTIVIQKESSSNRGVIWDGQQRLFALVTLLCSTRDLLMSSSDPKIYSEGVFLDRSYIQRTGIGRASSPVLTLSDFDQKTFREFVYLPQGHQDKKTLSQWRNLTPTLQSNWSLKVIEAYGEILDWIRDFSQRNANRFGSEAAATLAFADTALNRVKIILATASTDDDAFRTFETLNDRGLSLSAADLIKNWLLSKLQGASQGRNQMRQDWDDMMRAVGPDALTTYIRHFVLAQHKRTTKNELYREIKNWCTLPASQNGITAQQLIGDLTDSATFYVDLLRPTSAAWAGGLFESLQHLETLGTTQWLPLALAAYKARLTSQELEQMMKYIETLIVRRVTVGGLNPNVLERLFSETAETLRSSGLSRGQRLAAVLQTLKQNMPLDDEFRADFERLTNLSRKTTIFLLENLERYVQIQNSGGVVPNLQVLDVEHVYPRSDGPQWPQAPVAGSAPPSGFVEKSDRERLGNLALLHYRPNRSQKNAGFAQKKATFSTVPLTLTQRIASYTSWDLNTIRTRETELAGLAVSVWALPP